VLVDSFKFLPRSFLPLYEHVRPLPDESDPVWAPFTRRLADASIALLTSAGLSLDGDQQPFDLDRERREPTWGDPSFRVLPHDLGDRELVMSHLHVNGSDVRADRNVALPVDVLDDLVAAGVVGRAAPSHISVMGYQEAGLAEWRAVTAPAIVEHLRAQGTDGVVLAPV
jgi:Glycine/sarcosine/betaine reductase selenoprotein B (GRDB)